jgi:hypothetical protein
MSLPLYPQFRRLDTFRSHRDDYESFQRTIPLPAYHGGLPSPPSPSSTVTPPSLPNSHPESQVYNHLLSSSAIPLQINTVCRKIHTVLTGPRAVRRAEEHNLIDAHGMREIWRDLDQCWRELSTIRRNAANNEDSASRCDTERYACAWQVSLFDFQVLPFIDELSAPTDLHFRVP